MKKFIYYGLLSIILISCINHKSSYRIKGMAKEMSDGTSVYLTTIDENGNELSIDTAIIVDEEFKMKGQVSEPSIHFMSTDNSKSQLVFMLENSKLIVELNKKNVMLSKVKGSATNDDFMSFQAGMDSIRKESRNVVMAYRKFGLSNKQKKDSLHKLLEKHSIAMQEYPLHFVNSNRDSHFSLNLINLETNKMKIDIDGYIDAFRNLSVDLRQSPKGIILKKKLDSLTLVRKNN